MFDEHRTNEYFILRFGWNILLNLKLKLELDCVVEEDRTNEWFEQNTYWDILLILKEKFGVLYIRKAHWISE